MFRRLLPIPLAWCLAVFAALAVSVRAADAEPVGALDLERVVALAVERNAAFQAERARREEVLGGVEETEADAWPQVDVVAGWNRSRNPSLLNSPDFDDILDQFPDFEPGEQELWNGGFEITQPIWSGGKVRAALELAKIVVDATDAQIEAARLDLALDAAELYFAALRADAAVETLAIQRRAREESLEVVEARYELGDATELDRLRAVASLAEVAPRLAEIEGARRAATSALRALLGFAPGASLELSTLDRDDPDPLLDEPPALDALVDVAFERRPALRDLVLQLEGLERQRTTTVAEGRPQIDFVGAYGHQVRLLDDFTDDLFADWRVGVGVRWNVFDGGRRSGQVAQIDARREQTRWRLEELRRQVVAEIDAGLAAWRTARERLRAADTSAAAATEAARVADESFGLGVALQADLLDARDRATAQELGAVEAFYDFLTEGARLRRSVGLEPTEPFPVPPSEPPAEEIP